MLLPRLLPQNHIEVDATSLQEHNLVDKDLEIQWLIVRPPHQKTTILGTVYRLPKSNINGFMDKLSDMMKTLPELANKDITILGDFSIDFTTEDAFVPARVKHLLLTYGFKQHIVKPIRSTSTTDTIIDLIFSDAEYITSSGTVDINISDHILVFITKKQLPVKFEPLIFSGRSYRMYDIESFQNQIKLANWEEFDLETDPDILWDILLGIAMSVLSRSCPIRDFNLKRKKEDWMTADLLIQIEQKNKLLTKAKATKKDDDWKVATRERNRMNSEVDNAKAKFLVDKLEQHKGDRKKFWQAIKSILPDKIADEKISLVDPQLTSINSKWDK